MLCLCVCACVYNVEKCNDTKISSLSVTPKDRGGLENEVIIPSIYKINKLSFIYQERRLNHDITSEINISLVQYNYVYKIK